MLKHRVLATLILMSLFLTLFFSVSPFMHWPVTATTTVWYFRSDYGLNSTQTSRSSCFYIGANNSAMSIYLGIRIFLANNTEVVSSGSPVAVVHNSTTGLVSSSLSFSNTSNFCFQKIRVALYTHKNEGESWVQQGNFVSTATINGFMASNCTVYYYLYVSVSGGYNYYYCYFGTSAYDMRITGIAPYVRISTYPSTPLSAINMIIAEMQNTDFNNASGTNQIELDYVACALGKATKTQLQKDIIPLDPQLVLRWSVILAKYGIQNVSRIKWALDKINFTTGGLPIASGENCYKVECSYLLWGFNYSRWFNYATARWNLTKAYNTAVSACNWLGRPPLNIFSPTYANTWYATTSRLFETDQTINMFLLFYKVGITEALTQAEKWWLWANNNLWDSDGFYTYTPGSHMFIWDFPDLVNVVSDLHSYVPDLGNFSRIVQSIETYYLADGWESAIMCHKYMVCHGSSNPTPRLAPTLLMYSVLYGSFSFLNSSYRSKVSNMMEGNATYYPAWRLLFNTSSGNYDPIDGMFAMDAGGVVPESDYANAFAAFTMFFGSLDPVSAELAVPVENYGLGYTYNVVDNTVFGLDVKSRQIKLGIARCGTMRFLLNQTVTYDFPSPGLYLVNFGANWNNIASVTYLDALPDKLYAFSSVVSIQPSFTNLAVGYSRTFTSTLRGVSQPCSYQWYKDNQPISGANSSTYTFTAVSTGTFQFYLNVTDSNGVTITSNVANATVYAGPPVSIPGDVNGDGIVNIEDATLINLYWLQTVPPAPANVDINGDGIINVLDATIVGLNWLQHA